MLNTMIIIRNISILEKYTMYLITLGNCSCIALLPAIHGSICSFWKNISGHFVRFPCNHSLCTGSTVVGQCMEQLPNGYALITGFMPFTLRARFAHVKSFLRFYRWIVQTNALIFPHNSAFLWNIRVNQVLHDSWSVGFHDSYHFTSVNQCKLKNRRQSFDQRRFYFF